MVDDNSGTMDEAIDDKLIVFAHSEVRGPTNKLEACRSVMICGGCRSVDQEERHQVLVEHHED